MCTPTLQEHEHPKEAHSYYWQVPRHQLVTVAGWGRAMRAAFLDPDDFLVLPGGQGVSSEGSCLGMQTSQTDLLRQLHWEASLIRPDEDGADGSSSGGGIGSGRGDGAAGGGVRGHHRAAAAASAAVLRTPRFDALLESSGRCSDAASCIKQHSRWFEQQQGARFSVSSCPVQQGGLRASRRPVVTPHDVVAMRVYTAAVRGGRLNGPTSPASCAFILHITNMLGPAQRRGNTAVAAWQPAAAAAAGSGGGVPGMLRFESGQELPVRQSLAECLPQGQQVV